MSKGRKKEEPIEHTVPPDDSQIASLLNEEEDEMKDEVHDLPDKENQKSKEEQEYMSLFPQKEWDPKAYNDKVRAKFISEMEYNPGMFIWKNSTDIDYISDIIKIIDAGLFILLLSFLLLKEYQFSDATGLDEQIISYGLMVNVGLTTIFRIFKYKIAFEYLKEKMVYSKETSFHQTPLLWEAIFEISLNIIHPSPYLNGLTYQVYNSGVDIYVSYEINDILVVISVVVKSYYMLKQVFLALEYNSNKMQRLFNIYAGGDFGFLFTFKIYLIRHPKMFILNSLVITQFFFGFIIRIVERPIMEVIEDARLKNWDDILWFCIITTSTIGYGDRVPYTLPARVATFFMILWGSIWTSLFVSTLFSVFNLEEKEMKSMNLFHRVNCRGELENKASVVVSDLMKLNQRMLISYKKNMGNTVEKTSEMVALQKKIVLNLKHVKQLRRELDFFKLETLYFEDDMIAKFEKIRYTEMQALRKVIKTEAVYKELLLDTGIIDVKPKYQKKVKKIEPELTPKTIFKNIVKVKEIYIYTRVPIKPKDMQKKEEKKYYDKDDIKSALVRGILKLDKINEIIKVVEAKKENVKLDVNRMNPIVLSYSKELPQESGKDNNGQPYPPGMYPPGYPHMHYPGYPMGVYPPGMYPGQQNNRSQPQTDERNDDAEQTKNKKGKKKSNKKQLANEDDGEQEAEDDHDQEEEGDEAAEDQSESEAEKDSEDDYYEQQGLQIKKVNGLQNDANKIGKSSNKVIDKGKAAVKQFEGLSDDESGDQVQIPFDQRGKNRISGVENVPKIGLLSGGLNYGGTSNAKQTSDAKNSGPNLVAIAVPVGATGSKSKKELKKKNKSKQKIDSDSSQREEDEGPSNQNKKETRRNDNINSIKLSEGKNPVANLKTPSVEAIQTHSSPLNNAHAAYPFAPGMPQYYPNMPPGQYPQGSHPQQGNHPGFHPAGYPHQQESNQNLKNTTQVHPSNPSEADPTVLVKTPNHPPEAVVNRTPNPVNKEMPNSNTNQQQRRRSSGYDRGADNKNEQNMKSNETKLITDKQTTKLKEDMTPEYSADNSGGNTKGQNSKNISPNNNTSRFTGRTIAEQPDFDEESTLNYVPKARVNRLGKKVGSKDDDSEQDRGGSPKNRALEGIYYQNSNGADRRDSRSSWGDDISSKHNDQPDLDSYNQKTEVKHRPSQEDLQTKQFVPKRDSGPQSSLDSRGNNQVNRAESDIWKDVNKYTSPLSNNPNNQPMKIEPRDRFEGIEPHDKKSLPSKYSRLENPRSSDKLPESPLKRNSGESDDHKRVMGKTGNRLDSNVVFSKPEVDMNLPQEKNNNLSKPESTMNIAPNSHNTNIPDTQIHPEKPQDNHEANQPARYMRKARKDLLNSKLNNIDRSILNPYDDALYDADDFDNEYLMLKRKELLKQT